MSTKNSYQKNYYLKNKEKILSKNKLWKQKNQDKTNQYSKKFREKNRKVLNAEKRKRYKKLKSTVNKIIVDYYNKKNISCYPLKAKKMFARRFSRKIKIPKRQLCKKCKINLATEKHHKDYNYPLDIEFVCVNCHNKIKE